HYVYRYINPSWLQYAKPHQFAILSRRGDLGVGVFPLPEWHVKEGEGVIHNLGLRITFEEAPREGEDKGAFKTVGDLEHAKIVRCYVNGMSMKNIAALFNRSTFTVKLHIDKHNRRVGENGVCEICKRAKSELYETLATRNTPL
ncbi:MAG: hypothetical protein QXR45_04025, partial [Candidatus Bathyarchaeia archaeon]